MSSKKFTLIISLLMVTGVALQGQIVLSFNQPAELAADAGQDTLICKNHSVVLGGYPSATGGVPGYVYLWSPVDGLDNPTSPNPEALPSTSTTYRLTVTDQNGCQAVSEVQINVDQCLGIDDRPISETLAVFPNPSDGRFTIAGINQTLVKSISIELISRLGLVVFRQEYPPANTLTGIEVDAGELDPGVYLLRVVIQDKVLSKNLIIR
ncbi:MAG: T9SS type A sorting domain-containing protein [Bacteroidales bacterium]|jgi:hypothetical protein